MCGVQGVTLKLSVIVPWRIGRRKKVIGFVELGCNIDPVIPTHHWSDMLASPRRAIATWHPLAAELSKT